MITILGNNDELLSINLTDVLKSFPNYKIFIYQLKFIEGVSANLNFKQLEYEDSINNSLKGLFLTYEEIEELERNTHQFIEIDLVIYGLNKLNKNLCSSGQQLAEVKLIDGSYWEIDSIDHIANMNLMKLDGAKIS